MSLGAQKKEARIIAGLVSQALEPSPRRNLVSGVGKFSDQSEQR